MGREAFYTLGNIVMDTFLSDAWVFLFFFSFSRSDYRDIHFKVTKPLKYDHGGRDTHTEGSHTHWTREHTYTRLGGWELWRKLGKRGGIPGERG